MEVQNGLIYINNIPNVMVKDNQNYTHNQFYYNNNFFSYTKILPLFSKNENHNENYFSQKRIKIKSHSNGKNPYYSIYNNVNVNNINNYYIFQNIPNESFNYEEYYNNLQEKYLINNKDEDDIPIFQMKIKLPNKPFYSVIFKIFRNDNLFDSFKNFCQENDVPDKLYKPILIQIITAMNKFHSIFNETINTDNFKYLVSISKEYKSIYKQDG
jgi:hypothetical protein